MKISKALFAAAALGLSACAGAPVKAPVARCNTQPTWSIKDPSGKDVGLFVCFGEGNQLLYDARALPPAPPAAAQTPAVTSGTVGTLVIQKVEAPKAAEKFIDNPQDPNDVNLMTRKPQ